MPEQQTVIRIFVSSPSGLKTEHEAVRETVEMTNTTVAEPNSFYLKTVTWESGVTPTIGDGVQEAIDAQIDDKYDIYLGIMSTRFGTPTPNAGSGTEHEFDKAITRKRSNPDSLEIVFFFQKPGYSGADIDIQELTKVEEFKSKVKKSGLIVEYTTKDDFKNKIGKVLADLTNKIIKSPMEMDRTIRSSDHERSTVSSHETRTELADPLAKLNSLEDTEEEGFLELAEKIADAMSAASSNLEGLNGAVKRLGAETQEQNLVIQRAREQGANRAPDAAIKAVARSMENFVESATSTLPNFRNHMSDSVLLSREAMIMLSQDGVITESTLEDFIASYSMLRSNILGALEGLMELSASAGDLPRATRDFNRAKRRVKAVVDGVCELLNSTLSEVDGILFILNGEE